MFRPVAAGAADAHDAVRALEALRAVTEAGAPYAEYAARVPETKAVVGGYLDEAGAAGAAIQMAVGGAMEYYVAAARLWRAAVEGARGDEGGLGGRLLRDDPCPRLRGLAAGDDQALRRALWDCAADRIREAEQLLTFR